MLSYQLRERYFKREEGGTLEFPNNVYIEFLFCPSEAFGQHSGKGRTVLRGSKVGMKYDANTGRAYFDCEPALKPLDVSIEWSDARIELKGNRLEIRRYCENVKEFVNLTEGIYYGFPPVLNLNIGESPVIKRVSGKVGNTAFSWEQRRHEGAFDVTDQEIQEGKIDSAWADMEFLNTHPAQRRIMAALQHFYVACQLSEGGNSPWSFMAEIILNYCKVLEVLFPGGGDVETKDAARSGLAKLRYSEEEIESNFIPIIELRNKIDVGHTKLSLFKQEQLNILHKYSDAADGYFRSMLSRLIERLKVESDLLAADEEESVDADTVKIIRKIGANLPKKSIVKDDGENR